MELVCSFILDDLMVDQGLDICGPIIFILSFSYRESYLP